MYSIKISIRDIVEFVLRTGNIDSQFTSANRAQEGTKIHAKIQRQRQKQAALAGEGYEKEVFLSHSFTYKDFEYKVEGRADGVWKKSDSIVLEEIKSTLRPVDTIEKNEDHWHFAQAKCYAYLYCLAYHIDSITVTLTYVNVDTDDIVSFSSPVSFHGLETFFFEMIEKYTQFAECDAKRIERRDETSAALPFPYEAFRKNQRELSVAVYKTIAARKKIFAQAPTGTGKTISTIFPVIKALAEHKAEKLFYITAKTTTRQTAEDAFFTMGQKGLAMRSITLTAKDKICFQEKRSCNPDECKYAKGHFDRANAAILDIITNETQITRRTIELYAEKHTVCPYEFSLDSTMFCDAIICDYNYVYDPSAHLRRYFGDDCKGGYIVLHDEAHNLTDRAREMFSAQLTKSECAEMRKLCRGKNTALFKALNNIVGWFKEIYDSDGISVSKECPSDLQLLLLRFTETVDKLLAKKAEEIDSIKDALIEFYFSVLDMLRTFEFFDEHYVFYVESAKKDITVKLLCLDASELLREIQKKMLSAVFFSATLTPLVYFKDVLGGSPDDYEMILPSPYEKSNLCMLIDNSISTLYKDRDKSYEAIADRLFTFVSGKTGNYFAFFPSYVYMSQVSEIFIDKYSGIKTITQTQNMNDNEKNSFLEHFNKNSDDTLLAFCVLGGVFSEGIDLAGEKLIGACIVGVGLPMITEERNIMADYFKQRKLDGFNYAYVYPGINKVMQAAGRVIRSENDKGVVLLIDSRYMNTLYKNLFPPEWSHYIKVIHGTVLETIINNFWKK